MTQTLLLAVWHTIYGAAWMFWQVGWSLVLGFLISGLLQAVVPAARVTRALGRDGVRETALAMAAGAASSSCSYASAAIMRTLLEKGAALIPSLAFLFASTNLVVELGIVLLLLMGWQFMAGEWIGGIVLVALMALIVRLTYPRALLAAIRPGLGQGGHRGCHGHAGHGGAHGHAGHGGADEGVEEAALSLGARARLIRTAQHFAMDWRMLWKDLALGFVIAGALAALVPEGVWAGLFVRHAPAWVQVPANALIGPLIGVLSFVCSIGNVPMAAVLWGSGVSFGGVLAFLYSDLIVLPLLDVYRRSYGWKMAAYMGAVFYGAMVIAAIVMDAAFSALGWVPASRPHFTAAAMSFRIDHTFWLNLAFGGLAAGMFVLSRLPAVAPAPACSHCGGGAAKAHRS